MNSLSSRRPSSNRFYRRKSSGKVDPIIIRKSSINSVRRESIKSIQASLDGIDTSKFCL